MKWKSIYRYKAVRMAASKKTRLHAGKTGMMECINRKPITPISAMGLCILLLLHNAIIPALPATVTDPYILQHFNETFLCLYITKQMSEADEDKKYILLHTTTRCIHNFLAFICTCTGTCQYSTFTVIRHPQVSRERVKSYC